MYPLKAEMGLPFMCQSQYEMFPIRHLKLTLYCKLLTFFLFCMGEIKFIFQLKKKQLFVLVCCVFPIREEPGILLTSSRSALAFTFRQFFVYHLEGKKSESCGILKQNILKCFPLNFFDFTGFEHIFCSPDSMLFLLVLFDFFTFSILQYRNKKFP